MELDIQTTDRLLNAIMFCLGPSLEDNSVREKPWMLELAESYNELIDKLPVDWKLFHHQHLHF
jgi:hypothetical protein